MSIFTRREVEERLNTFAGITGKRKLNEIVRRLNIEGNKSNKRLLESLAQTWEVVIISAFSELGNTRYETKISNGKTPDFHFSDHGISLVGDVVTVSDDQQHNKNPIELFSRIISEIWKQFGPPNGSISWSVSSVDLKPPPGPRTPGSWGPLHLSSRMRIISRGSLTRLTLPPSSQLREYLMAKVSPFFKELHTSPDSPACLDVDEPYDPDRMVKFTLKYNPKGRGSSGTYPSYTTVGDIERHVLWRRLTEKSEQFALATEGYPRVVFVCDGGCGALSHSSAAGIDYDIQDLLDHFWRRPRYTMDRRWVWIKETGLSAVVALSIQEVNVLFGHPGRREFTLKPCLYSNPYCRFPLDQASVRLLEKVVSKLPAPIETPSNALRSLAANPISSRDLGVLTMSENRVEMSALALLRILAGELTMEEFCRQYALDSNPFKDAMASFRTIRSLKVESADNRDDDKIVIDFHAHDVAIGPFRVPNRNKGQGSAR